MLPRHMLALHLAGKAAGRLLGMALSVWRCRPRSAMLIAACQCATASLPHPETRARERLHPANLARRRPVLRDLDVGAAADATEGCLESQGREPGRHRGRARCVKVDMVMATALRREVEVAQSTFLFPEFTIFIT